MNCLWLIQWALCLRRGSRLSKWVICGESRSEGGSWLTRRAIYIGGKFQERVANSSSESEWVVCVVEYSLAQPIKPSIHSCTPSLDKPRCKWKRANGKFGPVIVIVSWYWDIDSVYCCSILCCLFSSARELCIEVLYCRLFSQARGQVSLLSAKSYPPPGQAQLQ